MSIDATEWVVYQPPKSVSFGHQPRIRDPRCSWPTVQQFMADLTRSMLGDRIVLTCLDAELQSSGGVAASRVEEARRLFGPEDEQRGSYRTHPNWTLTEAQLPSAIDFALDDDKLLKQEAGPC